MAYSDNGTTWSGDVQLGNNARSSSGPAAAYFNGAIVVAYMGASSYNLYVSRSADGASWSTETRIGGQTGASPGMAIWNNELYVFYSGVNYNDVWYVKSADGISWTSEKNIEGATIATSNGAIAAMVAPWSNVLYVFYYFFDSKTGASHIKYRTAFYPNGDGSPRFNEPVDVLDQNWNATETYKGLAATVFNGHIYLAFTGKTSSNLYVARSSPYSVWRVVNVLGAKTLERPGIATANGMLTVVYRGLGSPAIRYAYSLDGDTWYGDAPAIGQTAGGGPSLIGD